MFSKINKLDYQKKKSSKRTHFVTLCTKNWLIIISGNWLVIIYVSPVTT